MYKRLFIMVTGLLAVVAFTAVSASAAPPQTSAPTVQAKPALDADAKTPVTATSTCRYRVNHSGGIYVYSRPTHLSTVVGSLAFGQSFTATCANVTGGRYVECGMSDLWKFVGNGYVKTKCLVRTSG